VPLPASKQIELLREVFVEWLRMHDADYDFSFYTQDEWTQREGPDHFFKDAELIVTFENDLYNWLNYPGEYDVAGELTDLAAGFGYRCEQGHSWSLGFIKYDDWPPLPRANASYAEKLADIRWQDKRKRILDRCKNTCEECGSRASLEVHHCYYRYGREPWQYPNGAFLGLCRKCHEARAESELRHRLFLPTLRTEELDLLRTLVCHCQYWFRRDDFHDFLRTLENVPGGISIVTNDGETLTEEEFQLRKRRAELAAVKEKLGTMLRNANHPPDRGDDWPRNWY